MRPYFCLPLLVLGLAACGEEEPSTGHCTGAAGAVVLDADMDADASEFHRDDQHLGFEEAFVNMRWGDGDVEVYAKWSDMPETEDAGSHTLPIAGGGSALIEQWSLDVAGWSGDPVAVGGELTLTRSERTRLVGDFTVDFADDTAVTCTFDLRRAYELDTDD